MVGGGGAHPVSSETPTEIAQVRLGRMRYNQLDTIVVGSDDC